MALKTRSNLRLLLHHKIIVSSVFLAFLIPGTALFTARFQPLRTAIASITNTQQDTLRYQWSKGQRLVYKIDYENTSESDLSALFESLRSSNNAQVPSSFANAFQTRVQSELVATVLEEKANEILVAYRFNQPTVQIKSSGQDAIEQAALVRSNLERPILATLDRQGRITSVKFNPALDRLSQNFARTLLAMTQFVLPSSNTSDAWEVQEDDPSGQYRAKYDAQFRLDTIAQPNLRAFQKAKVRYLPPARVDRRSVETVIQPKGELSAQFDRASGRLVSLTGQESKTMTVTGKTVGQDKTTFKLIYSSDQILNSLDLSQFRQQLADLNQVKAIPLSFQPSQAEIETAIAQQELGTTTLEQLLAQLAQLEQSSTAPQDSTALYLKLKAYIYLHPESSDRFGQLLAKADLKSLTLRLLGQALGAAGHPRAQAALISVVQARSDDTTALSMLIPLLASVSSPTQQTEDTLRDLTRVNNEQIASTAQLAMGGVARNLAIANPTRAQKIVDAVIGDLERAATDDARKQLLLTLGNAGSDRALPIITRFTTDASPELRSIAFSALRWIETPQAETLLIKAVTDEPDATVRQEAIVALSVRPINPAIFEVQKKAFLSDKAVKVRLAALSNLWQVHQAFPEMLSLVKAAERDASEEVRQAASEIIKAYPLDYFD